MNNFGIYTLANDIVYDQLVALLNSIEINVGENIPVCIIPYDDRLERVKKEIESRPQVTLFDNWDIIEMWDKFAHDIWAVHPHNNRAKTNRHSWYKSPLQRKFVAFEGLFEKFVFYDADSLAMQKLTNVIDKLQKFDFIFDDWEHLKSKEHAALDISLIEKTGLYTEKDIRSKLHCSSFFAAKRGLFTANEIEGMRQKLIVEGEVNWINGWWDDAFLFNYLTLRCDRPLFNFTLSPNGEERTGNCANADPFVNINNVLYNKDGQKPIHRIHYMSYSSSDFTRLCQGEDVDICYRDEFLYYRFLKNPEQKPKSFKSPSLTTKTSRFMKKIKNKIKRSIA
ncbi:Npun_R2821/Npun_R2822 family protein [Calothrix sp. 336/3]|uniref:Npun_R2821/Npun_R2822 family protein n=1 Tax=Calothrix sp. 336/3 TaxID=1337936 RepID=UPI0004E32CEB|nr:Npun_R2821/Npun_R2822 family protein [Calothrix sp. 336/3]AKG22983.1 methionine synthase [Calothrix sp. 336/3]